MSSSDIRTPAGPEERGVYSVGAAIRHHLFLVLVVALVFTAGVAAYVTQLAPQYTSTTRVLLRPSLGNALSPDSAKNGQQITVAMETEAALVDSPPVAERVTKKLGSTDLPAGTTVTSTVPPNTEIVQISVTARSPESSQEVAQAYADAFLDYREAQAKDSQSYQLGVLKDNQRSAKQSLKSASASASQKDAPADALARVQLYTNRLATLKDNIGQLEATQVDPGTVVTPADTPDGPAGLSPIIFIVVAAALGLGVGISLAIWRERRRDIVRAKSTSVLCGMPILATVSGAGGPSPQFVFDRGSTDDVIDSYRRIRAGVVVGSRRPSVLAVAGVSRDLNDSAAVIASNTAVSLGAAGHRVCLVDATLGTGQLRLERLLGTPSEPSLTHHLDRANSESVTTLSAHGIEVVPGGSDPARARRFLAKARLADLLKELRSRFDYVIVAVPSTSSADAQEVLLASDSAVLVFADKQTTHAQMVESAATATNLRVGVVGTVGVPRRTAGGRHVGSPHNGEEGLEGEGLDSDQAEVRPPTLETATAQSSEGGLGVRS